jgi:hypothetical protein
MIVIFCGVIRVCHRIPLWVDFGMKTFRVSLPLAITWPQVVNIEEDSLAETDQVDG